MTQSQVCNEVLEDIGPDAEELELYINSLEAERDEWARTAEGFAAVADKARDERDALAREAPFNNWIRDTLLGKLRAAQTERDEYRDLADKWRDDWTAAMDQCDALASRVAALRESLKRIEHATACSNAGKAHRIARNALSDEVPQ